MKLLRPFRWLLLAFAVALIPAASRAEVVISVGFGPPPLLVYEQPPCPGPGLIWTPGYWTYGPDGYYWVPGAWVPAPFLGALWTPGYWGWDAGMYYWHPGYWGYHVGYYGGINYGYGYFGLGFVGGRWSGGFFEYNTAVWRVNTVIIHRTYEDRDWDRHYVDRGSRVAFNGGPGGIRHDPDRDERAYMHEQHFQRTTFQTEHVNAAMHDRNAYYRVNHGRPDRIVSSRPLARENRPAPVERNSFNNGRQFNQPQNGQRNGDQNNRGGQNPRFEGNGNQTARPQQPQYRAQPEYRPVPPQQRTEQQYRPQQQPQYRPQQQQPQYRPQPQPQYRPQQPEYRPQQQQPQYRPQPQPQYRPQQPENRPQQQQPQYRPQQQYRPPPQQNHGQQQRPENRGNGEGGPERQDRGHGK